MKMTGCVFSIEEFSTFDGPGIRSTVFLKGCPLRCSWCHNPEGQSFHPQILKNPNGCVECGRCTAKAIQLYGKPDLVEECIPVCPHNLIRKSGTEYTPQALFDKIIRNDRFYKSSGGGVTFSGGEPLAQPAFLLESLKLFEGKVHRCIQTSGFCQPAFWAEVLKNVDHALFDLKVMDPRLSKRYIGVENTAILENFKALAQSKIPFTVRIPLIPGVTDTTQNLESIIDLLKQYGICYTEALPYNKLAGAKYALCDRTYQPDFDPKVSPFLPQELFASHGITLKLL